MARNAPRYNGPPRDSARRRQRRAALSGSAIALAYRRGILRKAGINRKISPHKLRHIYAANLLNAGAERVDIEALLGHESVATTQI